MRIGPPAGGGGKNVLGDSIETAELASLKAAVKDLTGRLDRQAAMLEGIWQFVKAECELSDDDLQALLEKLAAASAEKAAAAAAAAGTCPKCHEAIKGTPEQCFWCGHKFPRDLFAL